MSKLEAWLEHGEKLERYATKKLRVADQYYIEAYSEYDRNWYPWGWTYDSARGAMKLSEHDAAYFADARTRLPTAHAMIRVMRDALVETMREGTTGDGNTPAAQRSYDALAEVDRLAGDAK